MCQATTIKMPAKHESGISLATGANKSMINNKTTAWVMPAIGVPSSVFYICCCPGNGPGCRNAAKNSGKNIGGALGYQFHIRPMPSAHHAVGDYGRKEGFYTSQQRNGNGRLDEALNGTEIYLGNGR